MASVEKLGPYIRRLRAAANLSQRSLASRVGIDVTYLSKLENGRQVGSERVLRSLAEQLDVPAAELIALAGRVPGEFRLDPSEMDETDREHATAANQIRWLAGYDSDEPSGHDLLHIDRDVEAFATLIASRTITPPLSIALFGEWGSGKTFFMHQLRAGVQRLAELARASGRMQKDLASYKHIVQVEFNAWNYSTGNLWAGLVQHLFSNLRLYDTESPNSVARRTVPILADLTRTRGEIAEAEAHIKRFEDERAAASGEIARLQDDILKTERKLAELKLSVHDVIRTVKLDSETQETLRSALRQSGSEDVGDLAADLVAALHRTRAALTQSSSVVAALGQAPDRNRRLIWLLLALLMGPVCALLLGLATAVLGKPAFANLIATVGGVAALLTASASWISGQARWVSQRLADLDRADRRVREPIAAEQAALHRDIAEKEHELHQLDVAIGGLRRQHAQAVEHVAAITELSPADLLARLIQDRASSQDYRQHLGMLAMVQQDFSDLASLLLEDQQRLATFSSPEDEATDEERRINRIVLYIDDLDRCEPQKVVEVLQAVHLLLSFPLFVVVVAVDPRWVSRALRQRFPDLMGLSEGELAPTPHDYLEKIFQIPFWTEPLSAERTREFIAGLVNVQSQQIDSATALSDVGERTNDAVGDRSAPLKPILEFESESDASAAVVARLEVDTEELAFMQELATIANRSPRAVKRLVNVYRLIKARVADQKAFANGTDTLSGSHIVLFLLAVATGRPAVWTDLIRELSQTPDADLASVGAHLVDDPDTRLVTAWLATYRDGEWEKASAVQFLKWVPEVARFTFNMQEQPRQVNPGS